MLRGPAAGFSIGDLGKPGNHSARRDYDTGVPRGIFRLTTLADNSREITPPKQKGRIAFRRLFDSNGSTNLIPILATLAGSNPAAAPARAAIPFALLVSAPLTPTLARGARCAYCAIWRC